MVSITKIDLYRSRDIALVIDPFLITSLNSRRGSAWLPAEICGKPWTQMAWVADSQSGSLRSNEVDTHWGRVRIGNIIFPLVALWYIYI